MSKSVFILSNPGAHSITETIYLGGASSVTPTGLGSRSGDGRLASWVAGYSLVELLAMAPGPRRQVCGKLVLIGTILLFFSESVLECFDVGYIHGTGTLGVPVQHLYHFVSRRDSRV